MLDVLTARAECLGQLLLATGQQLAVAESCTGGLIAQAMTAIPGSSAWFDRGFVTYSNAAKMRMLHVPADTLAQFGAVSRETALAMVAGVLAESDARCAIAVTGTAGPGGGTEAKPVGTVFIALAFIGQPAFCHNLRFSGDREAVRYQTAVHALDYGIQLVDHSLNV